MGMDDSSNQISRFNSKYKNKLSRAGVRPRWLDPKIEKFSNYSNKFVLMIKTKVHLNVGIRLCFAISLHIALLGRLLSVVQIFVICASFGLIISPTTGRHDLGIKERENTHLTTVLWQIMCAIVSSVAVDTVLCVRLYLVSCFLMLAYLTAFVQLSDQTTASLYAFLKNEDGLSGRGKARQQQSACYAISHSLPWALAAGSALFVALGPHTRQTGIENHLEQQDMPWKPACCQPNICFFGLTSILPCGESAVEAFEGRPALDSPLLAITLLIFIPLTGELLCSLPFAFHFKARNRSVWRIRFYVAALFILHFGCGIILVSWIIIGRKSGKYTPLTEIESNILSRFFLSYLTIDPCLLGLITRQVYTICQNFPTKSLNSISGRDLMSSICKHESIRCNRSDKKIQLSDMEPKSLAAKLKLCDDMKGANSSPRISKCLNKLNHHPFKKKSKSQVYSKTDMPEMEESLCQTNVTYLMTDSMLSSCEMHPCKHNSLTGFKICPSTNASTLDSLVPSFSSQLPKATALDVGHYPKLCRHHQKLLHQHLLSQQEVEAKNCWPGVRTTTDIVAGITNGPSNLIQSQKRNSTATAVVMAATAAAVAAHSRATCNASNSVICQCLLPRVESTTPGTTYAQVNSLLEPVVARIIP